MDEGIGAKMVDEAMLERNDAALRAITVELDGFEELCSEEFQATEADWDSYGSDWFFLFYTYISLLVKRVDQLTPSQKATLTTLILRARGLKEKILKQRFEYPEVIDRDYAWMKR